MTHNELRHLMQEYFRELRSSAPPKDDDDNEDTTGAFGA